MRGSSGRTGDYNVIFNYRGCRCETSPSQFQLKTHRMHAFFRLKQTNLSYLFREPPDELHNLS
jgi:hypothetical protein